jgi:ABC-type multidrug transport system fused ATPase/permease subunit
MGAADANRRNFLALARLSGHFLDRLRGMETLRIFHRGEAETDNIREASQDFRQRTMEVLRLAFLSSGSWSFSPRCRLRWSPFTLVFLSGRAQLWPLRRRGDVDVRFPRPDSGS